MTTLDKLGEEFLSDEENSEYYDQIKIKMDIIELFISYREERGLSQKELAKELGLKQQAISRLERDQINPTIEFLAKNLYKIGYELKIVQREVL